MANVDRKITEPQYNEEFLSWYAGIFDEVFIALHPFSTIAELNPENVQYQTTIIDKNKVEGPLTFQKYAQMSHAASASKLMNKAELCKVQKRRGQRITWKSICEAVGLNSINELNHLLMVQIQAAKAVEEDASRLETLTSYCRDNRIFFPTEDEIHPLLEKPIVDLMQKLNVDKVWLSNEFNENKKVLKLKELDTEGPWDEVHDLGFKLAKAYDTNNKFLAVVPWDNFYTVLCGKDKALSNAGVEETFEGFWADKTTKPYW